MPKAGSSRTTARRPQGVQHAFVGGWSQRRGDFISLLLGVRQGRRRKLSYIGEVKTDPDGLAMTSAGTAAARKRGRDQSVRQATTGASGSSPSLDQPGPGGRDRIRRLDKGWNGGQSCAEGCHRPSVLPPRQLDRPTRIAALKIATFNINNVNRRLPEPARVAGAAQPDVVCLQELKATQEASRRRRSRRPVIGAVWRGESDWNGVAILARGARAGRHAARAARRPARTGRAATSRPLSTAS